MSRQLPFYVLKKIYIYILKHQQQHCPLLHIYIYVCVCVCVCVCVSIAGIMREVVTDEQEGGAVG